MTAARRLLVSLLLVALPLGLVSSATASAAPAATGLVVSVAEVDLAGPRISDAVVTVENTGPAALQDVSVSFTGPVGWLVQASPLPVGDALAPGEEADVTFRIQVPSPRSGTQVRVFTATATDGTTSATGTRTQVTGEALPDLAAAYDLVAVTDETDTAPGDFDGDGNSYSAQALAVAGLTPGASVEHEGATFTWPDVPAGEPGSVVASGELVALSGQGSRLAFLGSSAGQVSGTVTVLYADGSTSTGTLGLPNWCCLDPTAFGATTVAVTDHRNTPAGPANFGTEYRVFANSVAVDPTRELSGVILPNAGRLVLFDLAVVA